MSEHRLTKVIRISAANTKRLAPICAATRHTPAMLANMMIDFALQHIRLTPTAATVYDVGFWAGTSGASVHNARQRFPQLIDRFSGLRPDN